MVDITWAELINILGVLTAIAFSVIGVYIARKAEKKAEKSEAYSTVDSILKDVLSAGMENPKFRNQEEINKFWNTEGDDKFWNTEQAGFDYQKYDIYAEMCINMVENIYDVSLADDDNRRAYAPTIVDEIKLHGKWFSRDAEKKDGKYKNQNRFKKELRGFINNISKELGDTPSSETFDKICEIIEKNPGEYITNKDKVKKLRIL